MAGGVSLEVTLPSGVVVSVGRRWYRRSGRPQYLSVMFSVRGYIAGGGGGDLDVVAVLVLLDGGDIPGQEQTGGRVPIGEVLEVGPGSLLVAAELARERERKREARLRMKKAEVAMRLDSSWEVGCETRPSEGQGKPTAGSPSWSAAMLVGTGPCCQPASMFALAGAGAGAAAFFPLPPSPAARAATGGRGVSDCNRPKVDRYLR